jgi:hypothetical protein
MSIRHEPAKRVAFASLAPSRRSLVGAVERVQPLAIIHHQRCFSFDFDPSPLAFYCCHYGYGRVIARSRWLFSERSPRIFTLLSLLSLAVQKPVVAQNAAPIGTDDGSAARRLGRRVVVNYSTRVGGRRRVP